MNVVLTPWNVLAATGALLAFLIGLYTLVGRERKSPYLINSVFLVFFVSVLSAACSVASVLISEWKGWLLYTATTLLLLAILLTCWRVYKIYVRFAHFVDRVNLKDLPLWRWAKHNWRSWWGKPTYEHNPAPIGPELLDQVKEICRELAQGKHSLDERSQTGDCSLTIALEHQGQANDVLAKLAIAFLREKHSVQYLATSRHPIEFIDYLKGLTENEEATSVLSWQDIARRIVVVDAFTPHFGFTDSILLMKTREIEGMGVSCIRSSVSYAGMHTASSKAFNLVKDRAGSSVRKPVLIIYEDSHVLADLESHEQYRIFVRHVLPSERMWDGMFTVFTEVAPLEEDWKVLNGYASISLDLRQIGQSSESLTI